MFPLSGRRPFVRRCAAVSAMVLAAALLGACGSDDGNEVTIAAPAESVADPAAPPAAAGTAPEDVPVAPDKGPAPAAPGKVTGPQAVDIAQRGAAASKPAAGAAKASRGKQAAPDEQAPADRKAAGDKKIGGTDQAASLAADAAAYKAPAKQVATGSPVVIGNIGTYSGVGGLLNRGTQEALRVWAAWVNVHGGLNGHRVQIESYDDQGDPASAVSHAKTLQSKGVLAFLWNYTLFTSQTLIPAIEKMKIPVIGGDDFDPAMYTTPYMFPNNTLVRYQDATSAAYAASIGKEVAAVWWCIEAYVCQRAQKSDDANGGLASGGSKVVMNVSVSLTQPSYLSQCNTAKQKGVEFILAHLDGASFIRAKRDCAQIGYDPLICNVSGAVTPELLTTDLTKGPDEVCFGVSSFPWWESGAESPMQKAFHDAVAQFAPGTSKSYGSSGVWASGEILRHSSTFLSAKPTTEELLRGLHTVKDETFGGLTYPMTYTPNPSMKDPLPYFNCGYVAVVSEQGKWDFSPGKKLFCAPRVSDFSKI